MAGEPMEGDLLAQLRALAAHEHSDLSIATDAADEIERLRAAMADVQALAARLDNQLSARQRVIRTPPAHGTD